MKTVDREHTPSDPPSAKWYCLLCVHMQSSVCLGGDWGQDRRKLLDSGGVGIAEVSSPVLSVGMKPIGPSVHSVFCSLYLNLISLTHSQLTCIHTHTHTQFRDNTQTKHCKIHRGYSAVHINHMLANAHSTYTWLTHTSVWLQPGKQTQLFAQLKVSQSWASQNLLWTLKSRTDRQAHMHTASHTHATWM